MYEYVERSPVDRFLPLMIEQDRVDDSNVQNGLNVHHFPINPNILILALY